MSGLTSLGQRMEALEKRVMSLEKTVAFREGQFKKVRDRRSRSSGNPYDASVRRRRSWHGMW